jgi:hypothetical protein
MSEYRDKSAKRPEKPKKIEAKKDVPKKLLLRVEVEEMRLSHVLLLKELFRSAAGPTSIHMDFYKKEKKVGAVSIDTSWGVQFSSDLEEKLRKLSPIKSLHLES